MAGEEKIENSPTVEYQDYEICRKSKVGKYLQDGLEFFIVDMDKKKVYSSHDLRLRDIHEKIEKNSTLIIKEANYG